MKKVVLKLDLQEAGDKRRALKTAAALPGIDEISINIEAKTLTLVGTVDPVTVVIKLRKKSWPTDIVSVGPAKEPEKKEEPKKEEPKKADEAAKTDESPKKEEPVKENEKKEADHELIVAMPVPYRLYYPTMDASYYVHPCIEESPNACAIC